MVKKQGVKLNKMRKYPDLEKLQKERLEGGIPEPFGGETVMMPSLNISAEKSFVESKLFESSVVSVLTKFRREVEQAERTAIENAGQPTKESQCQKWKDESQTEAVEAIREVLRGVL